MIALYIIGGLLLLIIAIFLLPVSVFAEYKDDFLVKVKLAGITLFTTDKQEEKPQTQEALQEKPKEKKEGFFKELEKKMGFTGAVREVFGFARDCLLHIKKLLRHIYFKKVCLNITVASEDAAQTAIEYGAVCSAVYPTLALLDSYGNIKFKQINVESDFNGKKCDFEFSATATVKILFLIAAAFGIFSEYKKFNARMSEDERK